MDREILFRGKRLDNREWVYGYLIRGARTYIATSEDVGYMVVSVSGMASVQLHAVAPSTVGQYTGLTDKNGKKIFEGDLLSYNCGDEDSEPREVCFLNGRFVVQWVVSGDIDDRPYQTIRLAKIIGNIHNNPELMGGEGDG